MFFKLRYTTYVNKISQNQFHFDMYLNIRLFSIQIEFSFLIFLMAALISTLEFSLKVEGSQ